MIIRQGMILTVAGLVVGLASATAVTRYLEGMLFGLTPLDLSTCALMTAVLLVIAMLVCALPARRAGRIDPLTALREE